MTEDVEQVARGLHSVAVHLLRRLRLVDTAMGLGTARASALSVVVFSGPTTMGALAQAEQVRPPTMTRLIDRLERDGLVRREHPQGDRRSVVVTATLKGRRLLEQGRARRVALLAKQLADLDDSSLAALSRAVTIIEAAIAPS